MSTPEWTPGGGPSLVLGISDGFYMHGIDTEDVATQMVEVHPFGYGPNEFFVDGPMGSGCPNPPAIDHPVAPLGGSSFPDPAILVEVPVSNERHEPMVGNAPE